jgi:uncharacterized protein YoxC
MDIIFKVLKYLKKYSNLIKNVIFVALFIFCIFQTVQINNYKSSYEEEKVSGSTMETELDSIKQQNNELQTKLSDYEQIISGKDEQIQQLESKIKELESKASKSKTTFVTDGNYNQSTQVWNSLKALGLNDYVCAGILGNIMAEVGGQTLDISGWPQYSHGTYYGICQWSMGRKNRLLNDFGTTLEDQIRFLSVELFEVIPKDNSFYNMQDEKEAALYFAKYYERCSSKYYSVRQKNATKALEYFTK